jgi:cytoskeletal protein CcmA (bactofilin family)
MGATYTRQSSSTIVDGTTIEASHFNAEFDQILAAFASSTGHTHDGTSAEGGPITKLLGNTLTFGAGTAGTDITITFDGESNDGALKWMEDEDYFEFSDDILVASTEKLQFRDTAIYINSSTDGQLDLVADTEIQIAATTVDINGNVDISGTLTVAGALDFGDANISNIGSIALDTITNDGTDITLDSGGDIILDAGGADITLKDDGTTFGSLTNSSGELVIKSGSTPTAAITLSGANTTIEGNLTVDGNFDVTGTLDFSDSAITNVGSIQLDSIAGDADSNTSITFSGSDVITMATGGASALTIDASQNVTIAGDLTVSGDDITMATNTAGNLLIADGTNFNSVAVGSLSEISTIANDDVFLAVDTSGGGLKKVARSTVVSGLATSGAISNVAEDSTPQLGGDLDVNGNNIVSVSNGNISILPNGSGKVLIDGNGSSGGVSITDGLIDIRTGTGEVTKVKFYCESSNAHAQTLQAQPHSASSSAVVVLPVASGTLVGSGDSGTVTNTMLAGSIADSKLSTISTAGKVDIGALEIDGATDIGADLADADLLIVDDGAGGTERKSEFTRVKKYIFSAVSGDATASDSGALTIANDAVEQAMIADDAVGADQLASSAVVTASIVDDAVTQAKIADDAVGADQLASNAVVNASIASSAAIADSKLATISTAGKVALSALEIDGGTDISADLTTSDLIIVDDGAGGTNRKAALSRLTTFMTGQGFSTDDPTALAIALG